MREAALTSTTGPDTEGDRADADARHVRIAARGALLYGASYLIGALPFAQLGARRAGADLRLLGTGTVSGTGLYRVAGLGSLVGFGALDLAKGLAAAALARRLLPGRPGPAALAGGAAVAGHNWSIFLGGAGGRGIAPALGALLVDAWPGTAVLLAGLVGGRLAGETAIGSLVADVALLPVLARWGGRPAATAGAAVLAPMLVKRLAGNRSASGARTYLTRLLLDRDSRRRLDPLAASGTRA